MLSFASSGPRIARTSTYNAANGCKMDASPPAFPRFTNMMENSPRPMIVRPIFIDDFGDNPAFRPAIIPAVMLPIKVMATAASEYQTAPPSSVGSIDKPKLKKKIAPKKSRNGITNFSICFTCSVSASTRPSSKAPIASATCSVSEKPAIRKRTANTTKINNSFERIFSARLSKGTIFLPTSNRTSI
ncbi:hypothetical protein D3C74_348880 [compost metagenome]